VTTEFWHYAFSGTVGKKCKIWLQFSTPLAFEPPTFQNGARYLKRKEKTWWAVMMDLWPIKFGTFRPMSHEKCREYLVPIISVCDCLISLYSWYRFWSRDTRCTGWPNKNRTFLDVYSSCIWWLRKAVHVRLIIRSKTDVLNIAIFKYSLHNFRDYPTPKIPINLSITFNYCTQFPQNWQSKLIVNISRSIEMQHVCWIPETP